ncbi:MAG: hypothetical protein ACRDHW_23855 [Ktedonobacteraceae bacterium]
MGTNVTGGAANTKGSYVALTASSGQETKDITLACLATTSFSWSAFLTDIATGAAASEVVVISNILMDNQGATSGNEGVKGWRVTLAIAASTRIAARCQTSDGADVCEIAITLTTTAGMPGLTSTTTIGTATGTSRGTQLDPGGTINTKGSWAQLSASTGAVTQWIMAMVANHSQGGAPASVRWCIDIGTGAVGVDVALIPDMRFAAGGTTIVLAPNSYSMLTYIVASTRIAARASASNNTATVRLIDVAAVLGVAPSEAGGGGQVSCVF